MIGCIITAAVGLPCGGKFDYLGLIIGILALMITFVVAWQIWATIDSKNEIKSIHKEYRSRLDAMANYVRELEKWRKDYMLEIDCEHSFISGVHLFHKALWDETRIDETPTIVGNLYIQYFTALDCYISALAKGEAEANDILHYLDFQLDIIEDSLRPNIADEKAIILNTGQLKLVASLFKTFESYFDERYKSFKNAKLDSDLYDRINEIRARRKRLCDDISNL